MHRITRINYAVRAWSFAFAFLVLTLLYLEGVIGWKVIPAAVLQFLVYPHLAYLRGRRSAFPKRVEFQHLLLDAVTLGGWAAALGFPLWIAFGLLSAVGLNNLVTQGPLGLARSIVAFGAGALAWVLAFGLELHLQTSPAVTGVCLAGALAYGWAVGGIVFSRNRQLIHAREEFQESEQRYRSVVDTITEGIILQDASGTVLACNRSARELLDVSVGQAVDLDLSGLRLVREDQSPFPYDEFPAIVALRTCEAQSGVLMGIERKGDAPTWILMNSRAMIRAGTTAPHAVVTSFADITDLRNATEDLRRLNVELERRVAARTAELEVSNRDLEAFSYSVSHDLRAPLRAISGFGSTLMAEHGESLGEKGRAMLQRIVRAADRMSSLVDALLEIARVGRAELSVNEVDLSTMAHAIASELRTAEPQRDVQIVIAPFMKDRADPRLIHMALQNLLTNAWKYTARTAGARIEFGATDTQGRRIYFLSDNGAGFDPAYADKLFGVFQRLHSNREFEGIGIGLANVKRIIERHDGRIWAEGAVGKGATFYFSLHE